MTLFGRIIARAALPGQPAVPLARPKGVVGGLARAPLPEPTEEAPLDRSENLENEPEAAPLRRLSQMPEAEDEARRATAEPPEEEAKPLRRAEAETVEDMAQPLRRATSDGPRDDEASPMRSETVPEDEAKPLRRAPAGPIMHRFPVLPALVRRTAPDPEALTAENSPEPAENSAQPDPEPAMALRREASPRAAATAMVPPMVFDPPRAPAAPEMAAEVATPDLPPSLTQAFEPDRTPPEQPDWPMFEPHFTPQPTAQERPRVVIEHIDVTVSEPASAGHGQADFAASLSRALRSRYLGG